MTYFFACGSFQVWRCCTQRLLWVSLHCPGHSFGAWPFPGEDPQFQQTCSWNQLFRDFNWQLAIASIAKLLPSLASFVLFTALILNHAVTCSLVSPRSLYAVVLRSSVVCQGSPAEHFEAISTKHLAVNTFLEWLHISTCVHVIASFPDSLTFTMWIRYIEHHLAHEKRRAHKIPRSQPEAAGSSRW